jgi:DNA-nicking Smr family endonuclease
MTGDGGKNKPRRRKLLSEEDAALWNFVARSIGPTKGKSRVREVEPDLNVTVDAHAGLEETRRPPAAGPGRKSTSPTRVTPVPRASPPVSKARNSEPAYVPLDRKKARRIARGTEEIEARLDLHGMTQDDAHSALMGFVRRCQAAGFRTVLVITGKGGTGQRHHDEWDDHHERPRGVLRRNVPRWLAGPEIGSLVISYTTAHIRHGGEGALYVQLRRKG